MLVAAGGILALAVVGVVLAVTLGKGGGSTKPITVDADVSAVSGIPESGLVLGNPAATVKLIEFIDTSCPICEDYVVNTFPTISRDYVRTGKVKLETKVLAFVGPSSARGRELILAAAKQNRAFPLIELLYHNQGNEQKAWLTDELAKALAAKIPGLDAARLLSDAKSESVRTRSATFDQEARADGVSGTPTFLLVTKDGKTHLLGSGNPGIEPFRSALDRALAG